MASRYGREQVKVTAVSILTETEKLTRILKVVNCRQYIREDKHVKVVEQVLHLVEFSRKMRFRQRFWTAEKRILASLQQLHFAEDISYLRTFKGIELSKNQ